MNRDLKFRAWSKKTKKMYNEVIHVNLNSSECVWATVKRFCPIEAKTINYSIQPKDCELMQYIGLKDKNGIEIYEGDILKSFYHRDKTGYDIKHTQETVELEINSYCGRIGFEILFPENSEIIGNIYENKNLLK